MPATTDLLMLRRLGIAVAIYHLFDRKPLPQTLDQCCDCIVASWTIFGELDAPWLDGLRLPTTSA